MRTLPKFLLAILLFTVASVGWAACPEGYRKDWMGNCVEAPLHKLLRTKYCAGCDLTDAKLLGQDLYGANMHGATLFGANLSKADLRKANLNGTSWEWANLSGANLAGAQFSSAVLIGANLTGADLTGANLFVANLRDANLSRVNLTAADLTGAVLRGANLSGANLSGALLTNIKTDSSTIWPKGFKKPRGVVSSSQSTTASTPSTPTTSYTATASFGSTDSSSSIAVTGSGNLASKTTQTTDTSALDLAFWTSIQDSDDPDMFRAYIQKYPEGEFVLLAKLNLKKLTGSTDTVVSAIPDLNYGRYHALVIGNNDYDYLSDLKTAVNDAEGVASLLKEDYGFEVSLLKNATRVEIVDALARFRKTVSANDSLLIYYAGHGHLDEAADEGYWLPVDADSESPSRWLQNGTVVAQVRAMDAKHVMIVADSCFSGTLTRAIKIELRTPSDLQKIVEKKARTALTSGGLEPVLDSRGGEHSVFAKSFISLLEENPGVLDAHQLFSSLRTQVALNSSQIPEYGNIHEAGHDGGDFLFVKTAKISVEPATASSIEKPTVQAVPNNAAEVAFWQSIEDSDDPVMFKAYLAKYPNGEFVVLSKIKLEKLEVVDTLNQPQPEKQIGKSIGVETESGLQYRILKSGYGSKPTLNSRVVVDYVGKKIDGTIFDSSFTRGVPATFVVGGLILGWQEALQLMREGDIWEVVIPPKLAYGEKGAGATIGPNETLIFEIELLEVENY